MKIKQRAGLASGLVALLMAGTSQADPYAIRYTGTIDYSTLSWAIEGETYDVTLVFDNGGETGTSQTWEASDLRCAIWRFNDARNVVFTQDLTADSADTVIGSAGTNSSGELESMFEEVTDQSVNEYDLVGETSTIVYWYANTSNGVFYDDQGGGVNDVAGGVDMDPAQWTNPVAVGDNCDVAALPDEEPEEPVTVPTMTEWAMILLSTLLAGSAALILQRRESRARRA